MYAVIRSGGKQYKVTEGARIRVEKLDAEEGAKVSLDEVLMVADGQTVTVGDPLVKGAKVSATVAGHGRHDKIHIVKFKRRKHHEKRQGHRQHYTDLAITGIKAK